MDNFLVLDLETSGLDPSTHEILEIAAAEMTPHGVLTGKTVRGKVKPRKDVDPKAAAVNGYTPAKWEFAEELEFKKAEFNRVFFGSTLQILGWNPSFDEKFIRSWVSKDMKLSYHPVDVFSIIYTRILAANPPIAIEGGRRYPSLGDAVRHFLPGNLDLIFHSAEGDMDACVLLYRMVLKAHGLRGW